MKDNLRWQYVARLPEAGSSSRKPAWQENHSAVAARRGILSGFVKLTLDE